MLSSSAGSGVSSKRYSTPPLQIESERCPSIPPPPVKKSHNHNSSSYNATTDSTSTTSTRMRKDRANQKKKRRITLTPCKRRITQDSSPDDFLAVKEGVDLLLKFPHLHLALTDEEEVDDINFSTPVRVQSKGFCSHHMSNTSSCTEFLPVQALVHPPNISVVEGANKDELELPAIKLGKKVRPMFRRVTKDSPTFEIDIHHNHLWDRRI